MWSTGNKYSLIRKCYRHDFSGYKILWHFIYFILITNWPFILIINRPLHLGLSSLYSHSISFFLYIFLYFSHSVGDLETLIKLNILSEFSQWGPHNIGPGRIYVLIYGTLLSIFVTKTKYSGHNCLGMTHCCQINHIHK